MRLLWHSRGVLKVIAVSCHVLIRRSLALGLLLMSTRVESEGSRHTSSHALTVNEQTDNLYCPLVRVEEKDGCRLEGGGLKQRVAGRERESCREWKTLPQHNEANERKANERKEQRKEKTNNHSTK